MLLIDTAGRLQNKAGLMAELEKIVRVHPQGRSDRAACRAAGARRDHRPERASAGRDFRKRAGVTGLVMTKLDGTARGGILVAIAAKFGLPVHFIGVGEGSRRPRAVRGERFRQGAGGAVNSSHV